MAANAEALAKVVSDTTTPTPPPHAQLIYKYIYILYV